MWCALDNVSSQTAVWYLRGSHTQQLHHQIANFGGRETKYAANTQTGSLPTDLLDPFSQERDVVDVDVDVDAKGLDRQTMEPVPHPQDPRILRWNLQPGDVVVHDSWLIHMAPGNSSATERRRGYVVRYAADGARFDTRPGTMHQWWSACGMETTLVTGDCLGKSPLFPQVIRPRLCGGVCSGTGVDSGMDKAEEEGQAARQRSNSKM
jgi:hypothetical protein